MTLLLECFRKADLYQKVHESVVILTAMDLTHYLQFHLREDRQKSVHVAIPQLRCCQVDFELPSMGVTE